MIIKSAKNLCEHYDEFSNLAHVSHQPIFITKDGEGDLVLMSIRYYEELIAGKRIGAVKKERKQDNQKGRNEEMTENHLGLVLEEMYVKADRGYQVAAIHTFAIYFADVIDQNRLNKKEILRVAGLPESYQTEIAKGINLAKFVTVKSNVEEYITEIEKKVQ